MARRSYQHNPVAGNGLLLAAGLGALLLWNHHRRAVNHAHATNTPTADAFASNPATAAGDRTTTAIAQIAPPLPMTLIGHHEPYSPPPPHTPPAPATMIVAAGFSPRPPADAVPQKPPQVQSPQFGVIPAIQPVTVPVTVKLPTIATPPHVLTTEVAAVTQPARLQV